MSVSQVQTAVSILRGLDFKFILFLATEPLLLGSRLVLLVDWLYKTGTFYAMYSTSPEPLFSRFRQPLVDAGLRNWSPGIDYLPGASPSIITRLKVQESAQGLAWMARQGVEVHSNTTVHRDNFKSLPEILMWCQSIYPGMQTAFNFIEYKRDEQFDFFAEKEKMQDLWWEGTEEEAEALQSVMAKVREMTTWPGSIIQTTYDYLDRAVDYYTTLNKHCQGNVGPCVDCDGTLRLCGYRTGSQVGRYKVFDLKERYAEIEDAWQQDLAECPGCYWICPELVKTPELLDPASGVHEKRWSTGDRG